MVTEKPHEDAIIKKVWTLLQDVQDPEIPVLSVLDLGVVRHVAIENGGVEVSITPTYSGCPAMQEISSDIQKHLEKHLEEKVTVHTVLSPAWTTDWMTQEGKDKLRDFGIAPPVGSVDKNSLFPDKKVVPCPHCGSKNTTLISQFGSTACKSMYKCEDCLEPFDYFKCL